MKEPKAFRREALKITIIYLAFGFLWILVSDKFVNVFIADDVAVFKVNVFKGLSYVTITGVLIYFLIDRYSRKVVHALDLLQDEISARADREEEILYLSKTDVLTGIYNRRFYEEEKIRLDVPSQLPLCVIFADVNGLKLINDSFGHADGDNILVETANLLKKYCKSDHVIARIGGDEFCVLLPKTQADFARAIIEEMQEACEEFPIEIGDTSLKLSISFGYAVKNLPEENLHDIIKIADDAMRRSKLLNRKSTRGDLIASIKAAMLEKTHEPAKHTERMAALSKNIGKELNFTDSLLFELELAASLHDIGKMSIADCILTKIGLLTDADWVEIKKHPEAGYRIAQAATELVPIADYLLAHHERWDGTGYPQGLSGENIPLISRIISIVDAYDVMTAGRAYQLPLSNQEAATEILKNAGTQFDPELAKLFVERVLFTLEIS